MNPVVRRKSADQAGNASGEHGHAVNLGRFDTIEERDSWHAWVSHGCELLRKVLRGDDEHRRRLTFKHRPDGPSPMDPESLSARITQAITRRDRLIEALGFPPGTDLDVIYHRSTERGRRGRTCIAMAHCAILTHWDPPRMAINTGARHNPRRTLSESDHDERARDADRIAAGMIP
jgi:hypothetical protein